MSDKAIYSKYEIEEVTINVIERHAEIIAEIIATRIEKGLTQEVVARKCGLKQSAIARLETSSRIPNFRTILKVAEVLGLEIVIKKAKELEKIELKPSKKVNFKAEFESVSFENIKDAFVLIGRDYNSCDAETKRDTVGDVNWTKIRTNVA